jgi:RNA polymerase sigma factor (sigma-70 family)
MDDALLVSRAKAGDLDAFGQLYDQYFNRIYDFSWRIIRDADEAADVTQDVFMKAMQNLPSLAKVASFKSWLFTIAHNAAVTRAERSARTVPLPQPLHEEAFGTFDVPDPSRLDNPEIAAGDSELASLVWEAAEALSPRDYALLDLHVRQGLDSAEIANVMGVSKGNAYTMVSRMKTAAGEVIGSYVLARRGSDDCDQLQQVLAAADFPPYTESVRRAVDEHVAGCDICSRAKRRFTTPLEILGGFALVPAPLALKGDVWGDVSSGWYVTGPGALDRGGQAPVGDALPLSPYAAAGGGFGGSGGGMLMSEGGDGGWDRNRVLWFLGGVAGLLIFAFAGGAIIAGALGGGDEEGGASGTATASRTATAAITRTPGVAIETPSPNLTPPTEPPADTPTPTLAPPTPTETAVIATATVAGTLTATATTTSLSGTATATATPITIGTPTPTGTPCSSAACPPTATPTP